MMTFCKGNNSFVSYYLLFHYADGKEIHVFQMLLFSCSEGPVRFSPALCVEMSWQRLINSCFELFS